MCGVVVIGLRRSEHPRDASARFYHASRANQTKPGGGRKLLQGDQALRYKSPIQNQENCKSQENRNSDQNFPVLFIPSRRGNPPIALRQSHTAAPVESTAATADAEGGVVLCLGEQLLHVGKPQFFSLAVPAALLSPLKLPHGNPVAAVQVLLSEVGAHVLDKGASDGRQQIERLAIRSSEHLCAGLSGFT